MITRLKTLIQSLEMNESSFARQIGIQQRTLNMYLKEQRKVSYEVLDKILKAFPDLSAEWLMRGNGEMFKGVDINSERIMKLIDTITTLQEAINTKSETIAMLQERIKQLER